MISRTDIHKARESLGLDQHEMAKALGVSVATIYRWEGDGAAGAAPLHTDALIQFVHWTKASRKAQRKNLAEQLRRCGRNRLAAFHCLLHHILGGT